jgi:hypothetical protein
MMSTRRRSGAGALVAEGNAERSLALDVAAVAADPTRARPAVRAALGLAATGDVDAALALLVSAPGGAPARTLGVGDASVEARADILAAAGRWQARAALWAEGRGRRRRGPRSAWPWPGRRAPATTRSSSSRAAPTPGR